MSPERLEKLLTEYYPNRQRAAWLQHKLGTLNRYLIIAKGQMINDGVSLSQAITGMPHGSGTGDPTAKLAIRIASGEVSNFVKEIEFDIREIESELAAVRADLEITEAALETLNDIQYELVEARKLSGMSWDATVEIINSQHSGAYSKRSLQRLMEKITEKLYSWCESYELGKKPENGNEKGTDEKRDGYGVTL